MNSLIVNLDAIFMILSILSILLISILFIIWIRITDFEGEFLEARGSNAKFWMEVLFLLPSEFQWNFHPDTGGQVTTRPSVLNPLRMRWRLWVASRLLCWYPHPTPGGWSSQSRLPQTWPAFPLAPLPTRGWVGEASQDRRPNLPETAFGWLEGGPEGNGWSPARTYVPGMNCRSPDWAAEGSAAFSYWEPPAGLAIALH